MVLFVNHGIFEIFLGTEDHPQKAIVEPRHVEKNDALHFSKNSPFSGTDFFQTALSSELAFILSA